MSGSVAALVFGFATFDPSVRVAGVVLNRVGSDSHERMLRDALEPVDVPVLGVLRRNDAFRWRDRHLGLIPVVDMPPLRPRDGERPRKTLRRILVDRLDLDAFIESRKRP